MKTAFLTALALLAATPALLTSSPGFEEAPQCPNHKLNAARCPTTACSSMVTTIPGA